MVNHIKYNNNNTCCIYAFISFIGLRCNKIERKQQTKAQTKILKKTIPHTQPTSIIIECWRLLKLIQKRFVFPFRKLMSLTMIFFRLAHSKISVRFTFEIIMCKRKINKQQQNGNIIILYKKRARIFSVCLH